MALPKWKLENNLCRCCHSEGSYVNLAAPRIVGGEIEVYSEMILECFNVVLSPVQGDLNEVTYSICENCANKVRDALNFKNQVLECEKKFETMYRQNCIVVSDLLPNVKIEIDISGDEEEATNIDLKKEIEPMVEGNDDGLEDSGDDFYYPGELDSNTEENVMEINESTEKQPALSKKQPKNSKKPTTTILKKVDDPKAGNTKSKKNKKKETVAEKEEKEKGDADTAKQPASTGDKVTGLMNICAVGPCNSEGVYQFPSTPFTRQLWVTATRLDVLQKMGYKIGSKTRVCEDHFTPDDFVGPSFFLRKNDYTIGEDGMVKCTKCSKTYTNMTSLRGHVKRKHYKIPKYICPYCSKGFMTLSTFVRHKFEEHNIDERFHCNACKAVFNLKVQLTRHTNSFHMLGVKYKCDMCDYESFICESLYKHKIKHNTVKNNHCKFCKKSFLRKTTLLLHEKIHTDDRQKVCKECGQAFVQKASLNYHMTKHHPEVVY